MAESGQSTTCCGCNQPCSVSGQPSCCQSGCQLCEKKKCAEKEICQCNACTCGCQDNEDVKKGVKQCKESDCVGCKVICSKLEKDDRCRCTFCDCGCEDFLKKGKLCSDKSSNRCEQCKIKCKDSKDGTCICKLCNCGCDGVDCQCCSWCNPDTKCKGAGSCDRKDEHSEQCQRNNGQDGGTYYGEHGKQVDVCGEDKIISYGVGKCRFKCTNCGKLCSQDRCIIWLRVVVVVSIILASVVVMRAMYPEKFQAVMTKIRAAFPVSLKHPGSPQNNLVGNTIPGEVGIHRYPAFRPRAYAGLS